jgi:hypothetical protein
MCDSIPFSIMMGLVALAKGLVSRLLIYSPLQRARVYSALHSKWITSEGTELEEAYQNRIASV